MTAALADKSARIKAMGEHGRTFLVEAGAGSGKTAVLAGRIVMLLAAGVAPKHIAAVTFTELAASELTIRVRAFVEDLILGRMPLAIDLALPNGLSADARERLLAALEHLDALTCSTIHGFCQLLIKPYPVVANLDPGACIMDRDQADLAFHEVSTDWLKVALDGDDHARLATLIWHDKEASLRLFHSLLASLRQYPALCVEVSEDVDALWEAFERAAHRYSDYVRNATVEEPDSLQIANALEAFGDAVHKSQGIERLLTILSIGQELTLFTKEGTLRAYRKKGKWTQAAARSGQPEAEGSRYFDGAKSLYSNCGESLVALGAAACSRLLAFVLDDLRPVIDAYRQYKRDTAQLDFDDLIRTARDLLHEHEEIRIALGKRYTHVLVDEFQDTDPLQTEIFWRLCGDAPAQGSDDDWASYRIRPGALFLVGDPKQAIYRFRGADVAAYVRARELLVASDPEALIQISTNFRSRKPILDYVNTTFAAPLSTSEGQPGFTALAAFQASSDRQSVARLDVSVDPDEDGRMPVSAQRQAEAEAVALLCARLIGSEIFAGDETCARVCKPGDIALLAPTGTELWRYEEALERLSVPVATQAGKGLFRRQEVQDLIALTRVLADSRDTLALGSLLRGPLIGLGEEALLDMVERLRQDADGDADLPRIHINMDIDAIDNDYARDIIEKLRCLYRIANGTTPHHVLSQAIDMLRVRPVLMRRHVGQAERVLANVDLYLSMSRAYSVRGLRAFAEAMTEAWSDELRAPEGRPDAQEESVALFTMHAAKGLEWRVVVPVNTMTGIRSAESHLVERDTERLYCPAFGVFPTGYSAARDAERQELSRENVRLWYVATTRARDLLVLPNVLVERKGNIWEQVVDLDIGSLPEVDVAGLSTDVPTLDHEVVNEQTREAFAAEATDIFEAKHMISWRSPSRDEDVVEKDAPGVPLDMAEGIGEVFADADEDTRDVQGGWDRGLVIHKLFEEVLCEETAASEAALASRAEVLIRQLGKHLSDDPAAGLAPDELAACVLRGLSLPEIAQLRPRLVPECSVFGSSRLNDGEQAVAGIADAIAPGEDGAPEVVIDWKTDVDPSPSQFNHYVSQVRSYMDVTGAKRGLIVLVTAGRVVEVGGTRQA